MGVATIVSGAPFGIKEERPQCVPYLYSIKAADFLKGGLSTLVVNNGSHGLYVGFDNPSAKATNGWLNIPDQGEELAKSVVRDVQSSQLIFDEESRPCLFAVPGALDEAAVKKVHKDLLEKELKYQQNWFRVLVRLADASWTKHRQHIMISDVNRNAVLGLGLKREWMDDSPGSMIQCPACMTLVRAEASVCFACKVILNPEKYKEFQFAK